MQHVNCLAEQQQQQRGSSHAEEEEQEGSDCPARERNWVSEDHFAAAALLMIHEEVEVTTMVVKRDLPTATKTTKKALQRLPVVLPRIDEDRRCAVGDPQRHCDYVVVCTVEGPQGLHRSQPDWQTAAAVREAALPLPRPRRRAVASLLP